MAKIAANLDIVNVYRPTTFPTHGVPEQRPYQRYKDQGWILNGLLCSDPIRMSNHKNAKKGACSPLRLFKPIVSAWRLIL